MKSHTTTTALVIIFVLGFFLILGLKAKAEDASHNPDRFTITFVIKAFVSTPDHHPIAASSYSGGRWGTVKECLAALDNPDEKLALTHANFDKIAREKVDKDVGLDWTCVPELVPADTKT